MDADKFVRVWSKEGVMMFTGNIRLSEDHRLNLAGIGIITLCSDR